MCHQRLQLKKISIQPYSQEQYTLQDEYLPLHIEQSLVEEKNISSVSSTSDPSAISPSIIRVGTHSLSTISPSSHRRQTKLTPIRNIFQTTQQNTEETGLTPVKMNKEQSNKTKRRSSLDEIEEEYDTELNIGDDLHEIYI